MSAYSRGAFVNMLTPDAASWGEQARRLRTLPDLSHIELWLEHLPESRAEINALRSAISGPTQTIVHAPFSGVSLASHWKELRALSRQRLARAAEVCADIGGRLLTVHAGRHLASDSQQDILARTVEDLAAVTAASAVPVSLENMPRKTGSSIDAMASLDDLVEVKRQLPDIKLTLDVGHCLQNGEDYATFLMEHSASIANIHLHDGARGASAHRALGQGELPLATLVHTLGKCCYAGFVTLETLGWDATRSSWRLWSTAETATAQRGAPRVQYAALRTVEIQPTLS